MANTPSPSSFIQNYIKQHANQFNSYTKALGLPPTAAVAAALAVAEEARGVYDDQGGKTWKDIYLDSWNIDNSKVVQQYNDSYPVIINGELNTNTGTIAGDRLWVVEAIAPFGAAEEMVKDLKAKVFPQREIKLLAVGPKGREVRVV
jgi:hemolysin-activating ACP:hemolysin acyltransferase